MAKSPRDPNAYYENGVLKFKDKEPENVPEQPAAPASSASPAKTLFPGSPQSRKGNDYELGDVLQVVTGRNLATELYESVFSLLSWMCGIRVDAITYPECLLACREALLEQYPEMAAFAPGGPQYEFEIEELDLWLAKRRRDFGENVRVVKLSDDEAAELHEKVEEKLRRLRPKKPVDKKRGH